MTKQSFLRSGPEQQETQHLIFQYKMAENTSILQLVFQPRMPTDLHLPPQQPRHDDQQQLPPSDGRARLRRLARRAAAPAAEATVSAKEAKAVDTAARATNDAEEANVNAVEVHLLPHAKIAGPHNALHQLWVSRGAECTTRGNLWVLVGRIRKQLCVAAVRTQA